MLGLTHQPTRLQAAACAAGRPGMAGMALSVMIVMIVKHNEAVHVDLF